MNIAALLPMSLIDFPYEIAAVLFMTGCNFCCPFCHNPELVLPEKAREIKSIPQEDVLSFLQERKKFLDGLVITGGEPTIHPDLAEFIERVKSLDYRVKLDTNGSQPEILAALLDAGLVDYVAMDVKAPPSRYAEFAGVPVDMRTIGRSIQLIRDRAPDYEFRTTVAPTMTKQNLEEVVALIDGAKRYWLQRFVVPNGKGLVEPTWEEKVALDVGILGQIWDSIKTHVAGGGVR
jgi:pyruvate formate lyase activating enzyme